MSALYRVIGWTRRDGVVSVSEDMPLQEANDLVALLRSANPGWMRFDVEAAPDL